MFDPDLEIGMVCGRCDACSPVGAIVCPACGHELQLFPKGSLSQMVSAADSSFETQPLDPLQAQGINGPSLGAAVKDPPPKTPSQNSEEIPMAKSNITCAPRA